MLAQNEIAINDEVCNYTAPANAHYISSTGIVYLIADWTYTSPACNWECDEWFIDLDWTCYSNPSQVSCEVEYYNRVQSEDVIAVLTWCTSQITGTEMTHVFTENWSYTFYFQDYFWNTWSVTAIVDWIWCKTSEFNWELNSCNVESVCDVYSYNSNNEITTGVLCYSSWITSIAAWTFSKLYGVQSIEINSDNNTQNIAVSKDAFKWLNMIKGIYLGRHHGDSQRVYELPEWVFSWLTTLESLAIAAGDFPQHIFNWLSNLKWLNIWYSWSSAPASVEGNLPLWLFSWLNSLRDLTIYNIPNVPVWIFTDVSNLKDLCLGGVGTVQTPLLDWLDNLEYLSIINLRTGNYWNTNIETWIISNLSKLKYLDIHWIRDVPQLSNKLLNITWNVYISDFETISENAFNNMPNIKSISLSNNNRRGHNYAPVPLNENVFAWLHDLEHLNLYLSWASSIPSSIFNDLNSLKDLTINNTNITTLDSNQFSWLNNLKNLVLYNNKISSLPVWIFRDLSSLGMLQLDNNEITTLDEWIFNGLTELISLGLSNNKIKSIPMSIFNWLTSLHNINMRNNQISSLLDWTFSWLNSLSNLNLMDNCFPQSSLATIPYFKYKVVDNQKLCFTPNYNPNKNVWSVPEVTVSLVLTGDQTLYNQYVTHFELPQDIVMVNNWNWEFDISNLEWDNLFYRNEPNYWWTWYVHYPVNWKIPYSVDWIE